MRIARCSTLVAATILGSALAGGCETGTGNGDAGSDGSDDARSDLGLPPGAACPADLDAGHMLPTYCLDNPALPTCFQCVDLTGDEHLDGVCAFTCRMDQEDCPPGQSCTSPPGASNRTSYQPCRDLTDGHELGYCR